MPFNKIQPEQIQLATFFSSSGDISINQTDTGVGLNLSREITGDFYLTGHSSNPFVINKRPVFSMPITGTNTIDDFTSGTFVFNGAGNTVSGTRNMVINGASNVFTGNSVDNVVLNGASSDFGSGTNSCTSLAGDGSDFANQTTGAVIITDATTSTPASISNHSMLVDFDSGTFFQGSPTRFLTDVNVASAASGLFSGNLGVLGNSFMGTATVITRHSGQTPLSQSGSIMVTGDKLAVYLAGAWYGIGTADMTNLS
jgi:hypothetical protein|tara:strand:- start:3659 stop:4426 length:768 start_codon:yes stop_codon:yes gene_type:complete